jgi:hypothetical protein
MYEPLLKAAFDVKNLKPLEVKSSEVKALSPSEVLACIYKVSGLNVFLLLSKINH